MKKLLLASLLVFSFCFVYADKNDQLIEVSALPQAAQQFLQSYFNGVEVSYVMKERDAGVDEYKVMFKSGGNVEFDKKGEWESVSMKSAGVPSGIVPVTLMKYLKEKFPNGKVIKIEKDKRRYEVKMDNGLELDFDKSGKFLKMDD